MPNIRRRDVLTGALLLTSSSVVANAGTISGRLPWHPNAGDPPQPATADGWKFLTAREGVLMEALADRIIPPDAEFAGGKDAGCAVFVDRQLAGGYGKAEGLYEQGPFLKGEKVQGPQDPPGPAQHYRKALAAIDEHCRAHFDGKDFSELSDAEKDQWLSDLESGAVKLNDLDGQKFFETLIKDVQTGFLADPIYGGNRDRVSWRMIGFPGTRYDYREYVTRHNEKITLAPVSLQGRAAWSRGKD